MHFMDVKTLLSAQNGMNLYCGCTHGCIYCDARSACYHMEHAFEDVAVKRNAPALLEAALRKKRARCMIATGAMCDPYLPEERTLGLTRRCLTILQSYGFGLAIQTKSDLILRDLDLLDAIHAQAKCRCTDDADHSRRSALPHCRTECLHDRAALRGAAHAAIARHSNGGLDRTAAAVYQ